MPSVPEVQFGSWPAAGQVFVDRTQDAVKSNNGTFFGSQYKRDFSFRLYLHQLI